MLQIEDEERHSVHIILEVIFVCINCQFPVESHPDLTSVVEAMWSVISPATFRGAIADCRYS